MSQELIYTSVPRGLKPGSNGFCTVACTRGISANLTQQLESLSGYRHIYSPQDSNASLNPVAFSHLVLTVAGRRYHVLSRICDAGLDYTQRTNKFAHHIVLDAAELPAAGPAWLLAADGFMKSKWGGEPSLLATGPTLPTGESQPKVCRTWKQIAGDAGWGGVLAETATKATNRQVVLVFRPGMDMMSLVAESLALLPSELRWRVSFSTYSTKLPAGVSCQWRCVVDGSPEAIAAERTPKAATIINLCRPLGSAAGGAYVDMARTGKAAAILAATEPLPDIPDLSDTELEYALQEPDHPPTPAGIELRTSIGAKTADYNVGPPPVSSQWKRPPMRQQLHPKRKPRPRWPWVLGIAASLFVIIGAVVLMRTAHIQAIEKIRANAKAAAEDAMQAAVSARQAATDADKAGDAAMPVADATTKVGDLAIGAGNDAAKKINDAKLVDKKAMETAEKAKNDGTRAKQSAEKAAKASQTAKQAALDARKQAADADRAAAKAATVATDVTQAGANEAITDAKQAGDNARRSAAFAKRSAADAEEATRDANNARYAAESAGKAANAVVEAIEKASVEKQAISEKPKPVDRKADEATGAKKPDGMKQKDNKSVSHWLDELPKYVDITAASSAGFSEPDKPKKIAEGNWMLPNGYSLNLIASEDVLGKNTTCQLRKDEHQPSAWKFFVVRPQLAGNTSEQQIARLSLKEDGLHFRWSDIPPLAGITRERLMNGILEFSSPDNERRLVALRPLLPAKNHLLLKTLNGKKTYMVDTSSVYVDDKLFIQWLGVYSGTAHNFAVEVTGDTPEILRISYAAESGPTGPRIPNDRDKYRISLELRGKLEAIPQGDNKDKTKISIEVEPRICRVGLLATDEVSMSKTLDSGNKTRNRGSKSARDNHTWLDDLERLRNDIPALEIRISSLNKQIADAKKTTDKSETIDVGKLRTDMEDQQLRLDHIKHFVALVDGLLDKAGDAELCYCVYQDVKGNHVNLLKRDPRQADHLKTK